MYLHGDRGAETGDQYFIIFITLILCIFALYKPTLHVTIAQLHKSTVIYYIAYLVKILGTLEAPSLDFSL